MKKLVCICLLMTLALGICACGNADKPNTTTDPQNIETVTTTEPEKEPSGYTVKVVDEGGNPIAGAMVQLCAESCMPAITDANGVATFPNAEIRDDYKVSFVSLPQGYDYVDETQEFYFEAGKTEITLTLKALA